MTPKRPRDPNQLAKSIIDIATEQTSPLTRPEAIRAMMETNLHILAKDPGEKLAKTARTR
jgi:hypothetical protein